MHCMHALSKAKVVKFEILLQCQLAVRLRLIFEASGCLLKKYRESESCDTTGARSMQRDLKNTTPDKYMVIK